MTNSSCKIFSSRANLLISGEYFVLSGAQALAVPLKQKQHLRIEAYEDDNENLDWKVYELGKPSFKAVFSLPHLQIRTTYDIEKAFWLRSLLKEAMMVNPKFINASKSYKAISNIDFKTNWGWGSSATVIANVAKWSNIEAFKLNNKVSSGSGYDVVVSNSSTPVLYRFFKDRPEVQPVDFNPPFKHSIFFVYQGKKQSTSLSIQEYLSLGNKNTSLTNEISSITRKMIQVQEIDEFMEILRTHEDIVSRTIGIPKLKDQYFNDFNGEVKSLGAWGGDFAMVVSKLAKQDIKNYFYNKGLKTIFEFDDIIKN